MTSQEILASLSQLENELESIASARLLVEKTVASYKDVQEEIKVFFSEFHKVTKALNTVSRAFEAEKTTLTSDVKSTVDILKSQLHNLSKTFTKQCNEVLLEFEVSSHHTVDGFISKLDPITRNYEINNETFKERISNLTAVQTVLTMAIESVKSLKTDLNILQNQFEDSQKRQDAAVSELKTIATDHNLALAKMSEDLTKKHEEKLVSSTDTIISTLNDRFAKINEILNAIKQTVDIVSLKIDTVKAKQDSIVSALEHIKTDISGLGSIIDNKTKETHGRFDDLLKTDKSTKTIIIINVVISIIALLIAFFK